jgi:hypothetical protein
VTHTNAASLPLFRNFRLNSLHPNLPLTQRRTHQVTAQFNAAEELWRRLEVKRLRRRELCPDLAPELQFQLDLLDFANARSPEDCIGFVVDS